MEIRKGNVVKHNNDLYLIVEAIFINPGKGSAFTKTKMKSITTGKTVELTIKSGEGLDVVDVVHQKMQYLYKTGEKYSFMNQENYEIYELDAEVVGDDAKYLKDGLELHAIMHGDSVVALELPKKIEYKVVDAPPAVKGDTASGRIMKDTIMENGLLVRCPAFIEPGNIVLVNTDTGEYCERVNK